MLSLNGRFRPTITNCSHENSNKGKIRFFVPGCSSDGFVDGIHTQQINACIIHG